MSHLDHEKLDVYQAAVEFVALTDDVVKHLPRGRSYLADQLRRAATSIALNIAEGAGEFSRDDKARFYRMAKRSATECAAILDICRRLELMEKSRFASRRELLLRIVAMLTKMAQTRAQSGTGTGKTSPAREGTRYGGASQTRPPVVLSVEQALSMSYATLRFVHQGFRVIRVESTPVAGRKAKGDPNRYIGRPVAGEDRHSYYVAPNAGKEAIALNLKREEGRELLCRLVRDLPVDVFCTNTLPARHQALGLDYETLRRECPGLIWCSISAMGPDDPEVPGYDPMVQALCGYMDLTGHPDGPPLQCGPPLVDLKAGDEAFTQVILALAERAETGEGRRIDVSMAQVAVSWLHTFLPMLDMGSPPQELRRAGNEHRQFIPVNAYRTRDGWIYVAVGSDAQWSRLVREPMFESLDQERFATNEGRRADKDELHRTIEAITCEHSYAEVAESFTTAGIPHSPITAIENVMDLPWVRASALSTVAPDGHVVRLPPPAVSTPYLEELGGCLPFAPAYGEHTDAVLAEVGVEAPEIASLRAEGVIA